MRLQTYDNGATAVNLYATFASRGEAVAFRDFLRAELGPPFRRAWERVYDSGGGAINLYATFPTRARAVAFRDFLDAELEPAFQAWRAATCRPGAARVADRDLCPVCREDP